MADPRLREQITTDPTRQRVVAECTALIDEEVKAKGGLGGVALRGAYATVKAIKKGFVTEVVDALLDDWVVKFEPYHDKWKAGGGATSFGDYVTARADDVAEDLLQVTDERAQRTRHATARKAYEKMRSSAKKHVSTAVPRLGRLLERHLTDGASGSAA